MNTPFTTININDCFVLSVQKSNLYSLPTRTSTFRLENLSTQTSLVSFPKQSIGPTYKMSYRTKIVLDKPADWDVWISLVRCRAWNNDIWHLVDPDLVEKPHPLPRPVVPKFVLPQAGTPLDHDAVELYKLQVSLYKIQLGEFNRQKRAFGELVSFIQ